MSHASQEFLYRLICKLSSKQKRDFLKILPSKPDPRDRTNAQILFEELADMDTYDEMKLRRRLKNCMNNAVLSVEKNKLTNLLLEYLRNDSEETALKKLHRLLDYIEVLFNKDMFVEAVLYCERVKKEAWQNDLHTIIMEANRWHGRCLPYTERENIQKAMKELNEESLRSHNLISFTYQVRDYYHEIVIKIQHKFNLRNEDFQKEMVQLKEHPLFSIDVSSDEKYSFMPACYLGMARHLLYKMEGEYERAFQEERIVWDRINDAFDFHYKNRRAETIGAVVNYLEALSKTEHTGLFLKHMAYIERLLADKEKDNHQLETALRINQLNHLVKSRGEALTREDIIPFEKIHASGIADQFVDFKRLFEAYLANAFFIIRDYQKAIDYIHIVQEEYKRGEVRSDNYEHSRINEIVYRGTLALSHGMNNDDIPYLHSLANSYHDIIRHKSSKDDYRFEFALTDFFRFLKQNMSSVEVLDKIDTLEKRLDQIFKEPTGYLKLIRFDFDYPIMIKRWREYAQ